MFRIAVGGLALVLARCSAESGGQARPADAHEAQGDVHAQEVSDSGPLPAACENLRQCIAVGSSQDLAVIPGDPSAVADARNADLCALVLAALQGGSGVGCGRPHAGASASGTSNAGASGVCRELLGCCPSITEPGGSATCKVVAEENYGGQVMAYPPYPDECSPAIRYFQRQGFCKSLHVDGSADAPTLSTACGPGHVIACPGADGCIGTQVCDATGSAFGPCTCAPDGGSPDGGV